MSFELPKDHRTSTILKLAKIPIKELLQSINPPQMLLLTSGYIRENSFTQDKPNIPTSIMNYIAVFAFYNAPYEYKSDFDTNGIIYAIATNYGQRTWDSLPLMFYAHLLFQVESSGWNSTHPTMAGEKIENVLSRSEVHAGRVCTCNIPNSWISFNFGEKKKIRPSHYTLRHHCLYFGCLRYWNFEGSNDGSHWKVLRRHHNDTSLSTPHDTHTWTIDTNEYYQMFRIFMTRQNSSRSWILSCSGFEIYGHLAHDILPSITCHYRTHNTLQNHHITRGRWGSERCRRVRGDRGGMWNRGGRWNRGRGHTGWYNNGDNRYTAPSGNSYYGDIPMQRGGYNPIGGLSHDMAQNPYHYGHVPIVPHGYGLQVTNQGALSSAQHLHPHEPDEPMAVMPPQRYRRYGSDEHSYM
eukprot:300131_1